MRKEVEERKLHRMAKVHDFVEIWHVSQNLRATQKKCHFQHKQITAVGYSIATEEIVRASLSLIQPDGAAIFTLLERSSLPPAWSTKDLPEAPTQILNVCWIRRIDLQPVLSDEDSIPESISDMDNGLVWNSNLDNPTDSEDDYKADIESHIEPENGIEDPGTPE